MVLVFFLGYAVLVANLSGIISEVHEQRSIGVALTCFIIRHFGILFKIAGVAWVNVWWYYWRRYRLVHQSLPIDAPEPFMILDIIRSILKIEESSTKNKSQKKGEQQDLIFLLS